MEDARRLAEHAARVSYGRLLALLATRFRDIAAAEDALADAFMAALRTWPVQGAPRNPDAWLLTAARNTLRNAARHSAVVAQAAVELEHAQDIMTTDVPACPDERLKLLFVCAHPAIDPAVRTPLMLQTVLGLDAARIGSAFLVAPATMGQRLSRAKSKIRDAGLRFELPTADSMPERLGDVLNAIYAAYGAGWDAVAGADQGTRGLTDEAIFLCRLLVTLLPNEPEPRGLLALMLYCEARRGARRDAKGGFVPLDRQDARLWSRDMIIEAEALLTAAARCGVFGRFQCEAAIQSVHVQRPITGRTNHDALVMLYAMLAAAFPSIGVRVGQAAVLVEADRPADAWAILADLPPQAIKAYQPYWVTCAHAHTALGQPERAEAALQTAIGLTEDEAVRTYLRARLTVMETEHNRHI